MLGRSISAGTAEAPAIAVIGGGFAGSSLAYFLTRSGADLPPVLVFEPRGSLGGGLAYSTTDPSHRINVPAANMSLLPDDDGHFARWLAADAVAALDQTSTLADGRCFPARALFGRYVAEQLAQPLADGRIIHRRTRVRTIEREAELYRITCSDGTAFFAQILVIATSHPPPSPPGNLSKAFAGRPKFIGNPWAEDTLGGIDSTDKVLIVGTGLTMADMVASLTAKGHHGPILAVSRRGQRSHGHPATKLEPAGDFINPPSTSALSLLRRIRQAVGEAAARGEGWQGVFDKLRAQGTEIWGALSHPERMRLVRHLRPYWDTHRFRVAPQIESVLERRIAEGTLKIAAARVTGAELDGGQMRVGLRFRHGPAVAEAFDAVIATTGPAHDSILGSQPYLAALATAGLLQLDPTRLGLLVDRHSRAIGIDGPAEGLFVAGPLARGTFGELMGLPEVAKHALLVAREIAELAAEGRLLTEDAAAVG